jgi:hypothetical protein
LTTGTGGGVGDPALRIADAPVGLEDIDCLTEVVGRDVDGGLIAGSAQRYIGELSAATRSEDVSAVIGGALSPVDSEGVAVVEVLRVVALAGDHHGPAVGGADRERVLVGSEDGKGLTGNDPDLGVRGERHEPVSDGVVAAAVDLHVVTR